MNTSDTIPTYTQKCRNGKYLFSSLNHKYTLNGPIDLAKSTQVVTITDSNEKLHLGQFYKTKKMPTEFKSNSFGLTLLFRLKLLASPAVMEIEEVGIVKIITFYETLHYYLSIHPFRRIEYVDDLIYGASKLSKPNQQIKLYLNSIILFLDQIKELHYQGLIKLELSPESMAYDHTNKKFIILDFTNSIFYDVKNETVTRNDRCIENSNYRFIVPEQLIANGREYQPSQPIDYCRMDFQKYLILFNFVIFEKTLFSYYFNQEEAVSYHNFIFEIWEITYDYSKNYTKDKFKIRWSRIYDDFKNEDSLKPLLKIMISAWGEGKNTSESTRVLDGEILINQFIKQIKKFNLKN